MNRFTANRLALVMFGTFAFAGVTLAQDAEPEFVVSSARASQQGSLSGVREQVISVSQRVSYADLNLASTDGSREMEERVKSTAKALCEKLDQHYPLSGVDVPSCVRAAVDRSMADVQLAIAAAEKKGRTAAVTR